MKSTHTLDAKSPCPCGSGLAYGACCRPLHRGEREAEDPIAMMRSRYSAFATKDVEYLWRTLHPSHDDRARPKEEVLRDLRDAAQSNRYMGLRILDSHAPDAAGVAQVLFEAKIFHRGHDRSFIELSDFQRDDHGWRYLRGDGAMLGQFPNGTSTLTIEEFLEVAH